MEMARGGKPGKPKAGFPRFPTRLEIAFAIPTFPQVSAGFLCFNRRRRTESRPHGRSRRECEILLGWGRPGYNYWCPASFLMAGFEVTTYGPFGLTTEAVPHTLEFNRSRFPTAQLDHHSQCRTRTGLQGILAAQL
jgi:hypothetical protein